MWYRISVGQGEIAELRMRLRPAGSQPDRATAIGGDFTRVVAQRRGEADEFYGELTPAQASDDEAAVMRQAFAGMLWSKQFYNYDVARWLDGDPAQPSPPVQRLRGRNARWRSFQAFDVMSMPDTWGYPWFAAWDLAFHCVALVHIDPSFAKYQLLLLCREWFQHPTGAVPAYEWDFSDVNPPVLAWAALEVFAIDGGRDVDFSQQDLRQAAGELHLVGQPGRRRRVELVRYLFEGGFMGLDNIGPLDRSHLPVRGILEQSDATGWMAAYALSMATIAGILHGLRQRPALDLVQKFLEHYAAIADALDTSGVWDERDGMFYDRIVLTDGSVVPVRVRSMVAMIPSLAAGVVNEEAIDQTLITDKTFADYLRRHRTRRHRGDGGGRDTSRGARQAAAPGGDSWPRSASTVVSHAFRSQRVPFTARAAVLVGGAQAAPVCPRRRVCACRNRLRARRVDHRHVRRELELAGSDVAPAELPRRDGSGTAVTLDAVAADLWQRLVSIFLVDRDGRRPCLGGVERMQTDPRWRNNVLFFEYFHGDNGAGLGASHQTGWTGLVADVIRRRHRAYPTVSEVVQRLVSRTET